MPEDTTSVPGSAMPSGTDPTGAMPTTPATGEMPETTTVSPDALQKELADLRTALKKANEDAKTHRLKANELDKLKAEIEASKLSETERLQKQYDELKTQHDQYVEAQFERMIDHEIGLAAAKVGVNPKHLDKVSRLLDWEQIDIDEESGRAKNIGDLVGQLVKDMPELLGKAAPTSGGATNPSRSQSDANGEITAAYVADVMSGKIAWSTLTPERRTAVLNWQSRHPYRF